MQLMSLLAQAESQETTLASLVIWLFLTFGPLVLALAILLPMIMSMLRRTAELRKRSYEHMDNLESMTAEMRDLLREIRDDQKRDV